MENCRRDNPIVSKSEDFAVRIVRLYSYLKESKREHVMSKQLLRAGTSIGANIAESQEAQSKADFIAKLYIALKECSETRYWLSLLFRTDFLSEKEYNSVSSDLGELYGLLTTILKSTKQNQQ